MLVFSQPIKPSPDQGRIFCQSHLVQPFRPRKQLQKQTKKHQVTQGPSQEKISGGHNSQILK